MTEHDQGLVAWFDVGNANVSLVEAGFDASNQVHFRTLSGRVDSRTAVVASAIEHGLIRLA